MEVCQWAKLCWRPLLRAATFWPALSFEINLEKVFMAWPFTFLSVFWHDMACRIRQLGYVRQAYAYKPSFLLYSQTWGIATWLYLPPRLARCCSSKRWSIYIIDLFTQCAELISGVKIGHITRNSEEWLCSHDMQGAWCVAKILILHTSSPTKNATLRMLQRMGNRSWRKYVPMALVVLFLASQMQVLVCPNDRILFDMTLDKQLGLQGVWKTCEHVQRSQDCACCYEGKPWRDTIWHLSLFHIAWWHALLILITHVRTPIIPFGEKCGLTISQSCIKEVWRQVSKRSLLGN